VNGWATADGLFKKYFFNADSTLASMKDMQAATPFLINQFPENYPYANAYTEFRYTNWDKIPVLMPALYKVLCWTLGKEETDKLSLRVYFLNLHKAHFYILAFIYCFVFAYTLKHLYYFTMHNYVHKVDKHE
jgi:hypothetical protein